MPSEERYVCKLSNELIELANKELNEPLDDVDKHRAIDKLKIAYNEDVYGKLIRSDDYFLIRFLRAKKYNHEKALKTLQNYHKSRRESPEIFDKIKNPVLLKPFLDQGFLYILPGKAKDGSAVLLQRSKLMKNFNEQDMDAMAAFGILSMEKLLEDESVQIRGVSSIRDYEGFNLSLILSIPLPRMKVMSKFWQDAMPMRYKASHILNESSVYSAVMAVFKPFMKQKMLDRIQTHGNRFEELQEYIDVEFLPPYLGGKGLTCEEGGKVWNEKLAEDWVHDTEL